METVVTMETVQRYLAVNTRLRLQAGVELRRRPDAPGTLRDTRDGRADRRSRLSSFGNRQAAGESDR